MTEKAIARPAPAPLTLETVSAMTGYQLTEIALIARSVAVGASLQELAVFLHACRQLGLDPLLRQAYWIRRKDRGALQVGIDGFRKIADRSGAYAGSEPPSFRDYIEIKHGDKTLVVPGKASVLVWKIVAGHKAAFTGEAHWLEFYPGEGADGFMWRKMPHHMLAKCAEGQALRKAFPSLLSGLDMDAGQGEDGQPPPKRMTVTAADYERIYVERDSEPPQPEQPEQEPTPTEDNADDHKRGTADRGSSGEGDRQERQGALRPDR